MAVEQNILKHTPLPCLELKYIPCLQVFPTVLATGDLFCLSEGTESLTSNNDIYYSEIKDRDLKVYCLLFWRCRDIDFKLQWFLFWRCRDIDFKKKLIFMIMWRHILKAAVIFVLKMQRHRLQGTFNFSEYVETYTSSYSDFCSEDEET
jgi:hypothetical protein